MLLRFDIESLTTLQWVIKNYVAGSFISSPIHRCLHVESAKKPVIFAWSVFQILGHETPFDVRSILLVNTNRTDSIPNAGCT